MKKNRTEIIDYLNTLQGYQGYVQFSHRPIEKSKDIFVDGNVTVENEQGFIYEAHFCNGSQSIAIKQINDGFLVSQTDISEVDATDTQEYLSDIADFNYKVRMAQIWESKPDELCANMEVKKLTKVVFTGFVQGGSK